MCPLPRTRQLRLMTLQNRPFDFGGNINLYILRLGLFGALKFAFANFNALNKPSFRHNIGTVEYSCTVKYGPWDNYEYG